MRANLAEVLLAQGYQDLTGQIIRGVMKLVAEVETALVDLTRLAARESAPCVPRRRPERDRGTGPAVPGVDTGGTIVNEQQDVDALLSDLGM